MQTGCALGVPILTWSLPHPPPLLVFWAAPMGPCAPTKAQILCSPENCAPFQSRLRCSGGRRSRSPPREPAERRVPWTPSGGSGVVRDLRRTARTLPSSVDLCNRSISPALLGGGVSFLCLPLECTPAGSSVLCFCTGPGRTRVQKDSQASLWSGAADSSLEWSILLGSSDRLVHSLLRLALRRSLWRLRYRVPGLS